MRFTAKYTIAKTKNIKKQYIYKAQRPEDHLKIII